MAGGHAVSIGTLAVGWALLSACWGVTYQKVEGAAGGGGSGGTSDSCPPFTGLPPDDCEAGADTAASCCVPGRSCQGGSCVDGLCSAVELALAQGEAIDVIYLNGRVFWSTGGASQLLSVPVEGGAQPVIEASDPDYLTDLATDGERIFWLEYNGTHVRSIDPALGASSARLVATTPGYIAEWGRLTVDGDDVWWVTRLPGAVWRARKDGSESTTPQLVYDGGEPNAVAVDATHVYWTDASAVDPAVRRLARSAIGTAETPEVVATQQSWVTDIQIADGRVYWLDGGVHSITTALTSRIQIATASGPWALTLDDHFVYWTDEELDTVSRARRDGGGVLELATGDNPKGIAGSCDTLFFANWSDNDDFVSKVTK